VVHDSGPFADQVTKTFYRVSADGLYERDEHGKERLLVPRPLSVGQTWATETETFAFEGIEDFETFRKTVPSCAKITATDLQPLGEGQEVKTVRYYERSKGQIYKNVNGRLP
jgi:hypothetical protein